MPYPTQEGGVTHTPIGPDKGAKRRFHPGMVKTRRCIVRGLEPSRSIFHMLQPTERNAPYSSYQYEWDGHQNNLGPCI